MNGVSVGGSMTGAPACEPVPASVPGEFTVCVDPAFPGHVAWDAGTTELLLTWLAWVEVEVEGVDERLVERLHRLRGAVMVAGTEVVE